MGPQLMSLGGHIFEGIGFGFTGLDQSLATPWASVDVAARYDALHWTGPKSRGVTIKGVLFPEAYGGDGTLVSLESAAEAGQIMMLVSIDGRVHGPHVIEGIDKEATHHTPGGVPRKQTYSIKLKRYPGSGSFGLAGAALARLF